MHIHIITLFPELFESFFACSLIGKAKENGTISVSFQTPRAFAPGPHHHVDDTPYGGGAGMVMKPEPLVAAIEEAKSLYPSAPVIALTPAGKPFVQSQAHTLAEHQELIFVCGRYEGIDQRVLDAHVDLELSIGDYVLMGGEVASMVVLEATIRLLDGVVGNAESTECESFQLSSNGETLLEAPQYTRPAEFRGAKVPEVLLSGNHEAIAKWRKEQAQELTKKRRPDLREKGAL